MPAPGLYTLFANIFLSETAWSIKANFYVKPPREEGTESGKMVLGHLTKTAVMPVKTFKTLLQYDLESYDL